MEEAQNNAALSPRSRPLADHPWLRVPATFPSRSGRLGWLPAADVIVLCILIALALGHP